MVLRLGQQMLAQGPGPGRPAGRRRWQKCGARPWRDAEDGADFFLLLGHLAPGGNAVGLGDGHRWRCGYPAVAGFATCSSVCGTTPSSAATTSRAWSMPTAPGGHGVDEFLVAGTSMMPSTCLLGSGSVGVAQLDRDAALPCSCLSRSVLRARQRAHQGGFAVVDVPGGTDDHGEEIFNKNSCSRS